MKFVKILTLTTAFLAFLAIGTQAQPIIGGSLGLNYSKLMGLDNAGWKIGGNARTVLGYRFSPGFALHLEPTTSLKGGKWQFDTESAFFPDADTIRDIYNRNYTLFYLDIPLLAVISFPLEKEGIIPYDRTREQSTWIDIYIGPVASLNFGGSATETQELYVPNNDGNPITSKSESPAAPLLPHYHLNSIDFGAAAGIGVRFYMSERLRFVSDVRYTAGFLSADYGAFSEGPLGAISASQTTGIKGDAKNVTNHVASFNVGLLLELRKRR